MKTKFLAATAAIAIAGIGAASIAFAKVGDAPAIVKADDFRLVDHTGFAQEMRRLIDVKAIVLVSQVNGDAESRRIGKALEAMRAANPDVAFFMLNSSLADTRTSIAAEAASQGWSAPVLDDDVQLVGEQLGIKHVGETYVLEPKTLKILYRGAFDAKGAKKKAKGYLAEAIADVKAGRVVKVAKVDGKGASIAFPERARTKQHQKISYAKDVAPILAAKCVACHQEGGIGPFAMKDYATVKGFAPMIRESIRTDRMPPWHPDPLIGKFKHEQGLSDAQIKTLVHWVEAGTPRGEGDDPLAAQTFKAPEWPLGKPDLILDAPAFNIPVSGEVVYQYPTVANPLTAPRWVKAATLMPGDRRGVHHILAGYIPGTPRPGPASAGQWEANYGEYAVGGESFTVPAGSGIQLPAGGHMGFQMHYTPYGKEAVDNSKMALYFYPEGQAPERIMRHTVISNNLIELPPETDMHKEVAYLTFPKEAKLYSVFLHTHYRGLAGRLDMVKADGTKTALINLPRYDFNWQRTYDFVEPVTVPAGAKLVATYLYDNSVRNASNPDPKETVIWGDQSWEEMHYTSLYYEWTDETVAKPNDATPQMRAMRLFGMIDANVNDLIEINELRGRVAMLKPRFAELDLDKNGGIDQAELGKAGNIMAALQGLARPATQTQAAPSQSQ